MVMVLLLWQAGLIANVKLHFFIFNLLTDRLHKNGLPQIRHSKDQPTMA